jgi:uncharacterized RDD family membrane protein YckC
LASRGAGGRRARRARRRPDGLPSRGHGGRGPAGDHDARGRRARAHARRLGSRAIAGFVDLLLKGLIIAALAGATYGPLSEGLATAIFVPLAFAVALFYDILFELVSQGRTPGKRASGLRVLRSSGAPVDARSSAVRNLLRIVDGLPFSYLPTIVSILVTRRNQRIGDLAAGTIVVRDRRAAAATPGFTAPAADGPAWDVSAIGRDEVAAVRSFLARRETFDRDARARLAEQLHGALAARVGGADEPDPERFLERLAAAKDRAGRIG